MTLIELQGYMKIPAIYYRNADEFPLVKHIVDLATKGKIDLAKIRYDDYQDKNILLLNRRELKRRKTRRVNARNLRVYGPQWAKKRRKWCIRHLKKQKYRCNMCQCRIDLKTCDVDHIIKLGDGGPNKFENTQALCKKCHRLKDFGK